MTSKKILAFSSSRSGNSPYLQQNAAVIKTFLGSKPTNIAFIPFAQVPEKYDEYATAVKEGLQMPDSKINVVSRENATGIIEESDAIMVGGGNTFKLIHDLQKSNLQNVIREKVNNGIPYIGWSAGSNILAPTIGTTNDMPIIQPDSFEALKLLPFQINPHYLNQKLPGFNGETRDDRLREFVSINNRIAVIGLPEGSYLKLENGRLQYFGDEAGVLFEKDNSDAGFSRKLVEQMADISHLLLRKDN